MTASLTPDDVQKEPQLIIDSSGSQLEEVFPGSGITKADLITNVVGLVVEGLASHDSQGADEKDGGGVMAITFAKGTCQVLSDLNPRNFKTRFRPVWFGSTWAECALIKADELYNEEFGDLEDSNPAKPEQVVVFVTDGQMSDHRAVNFHIAHAKPYQHYYILVVGSGDEHDAAVKQWQGIAVINKNVAVEALTNVTDAQGIASRILAMVQ